MVSATAVNRKRPRRRFRQGRILILAVLAMVGGVLLLIWSADRFVLGAAATAHYAGLSPLIIGMLIVGFGTSAPELTVSAFSALGGNAGLAVGNAYGSNIANIGLILGLTAMIRPLAVHSRVVRRELPVLAGVTLFGTILLWGGHLSRLEAIGLLAVLVALTLWMIREDRTAVQDALNTDVDQELAARMLSLPWAIFWLLAGLALLVGSSRLLVWGAVSLARTAGLSELFIGLTVVAVGTSLPELASSVAAARRGEPDLAVGNIVGSNLFNTLAVVGVAGVVEPFAVADEVLHRDVPVMGAMTVLLFLFCFGFGGPGRLRRWEGGVLLAGYVGYTAFLIWSVAL